MKNTLTVNLSVTDCGNDYYPDDGQSFKIGDKVVVFAYFDTNGNEWNKARHTESGDDEMVKKQYPSYSETAGITHYLVGIKTVSRIFKTKIWVK